ncbi:hypothetical protein L3X38_034775 [Prunus dulcis]|uniref:Uncharacterized protein n=1 Tax=Prunus dulcis TaxID=3755 RepID=A0AAD4YY21_PRUDU|nr:hypothetical protein L3X38_034775 [Prunus dulcis]
MEALCSLLGMRWRPSIFGWEVSCKSSRSFGIGRFRFFHILRLRLLSFLLTNLCIVALQMLGSLLTRSGVRWSSSSDRTPAFSLFQSLSLTDLC